jgi:ubiquitin carboxyl-terminal hydrolase 7
MVDFNQPHNNANYEIVRVRRDSTYGNFRKVLAERFGIPEKRSRLWVFVNRQNKTIRIDSLVPDIHPNTSK